MIEQLIDEICDTHHLHRCIQKVVDLNELEALRTTVLNRIQYIEKNLHQQNFRGMLELLGTMEEITDINQLKVGETILLIGDNVEYYNEYAITQITEIVRITSDKFRLFSNVLTTTDNHDKARWRYSSKPYWVLDYDINNKIWLSPYLYQEMDLIRVFRMPNINQ